MSNLSRFALLCGVLCLLSSLAFTQGAPSVPRWDGFPTPIRVACVGDSITAGYGASSPACNYPAVLGRLLGARFDVRNFGVSGTTMLQHGDSPYWVTGAFQQALDFLPNVVILKLGTNDSKPQNWDKFKAEYAPDYRAMLQRFSTLSSKPRIWICLPVPVYQDGQFGIRAGVVKDEILPLLKGIAADTNTPLIDLFTAMSEKAQYFPDGIHPNDAGYMLLAQAIAGTLTGIPLITPNGDLLLDPILVTLSPTVKDAAIHYTLDGSEPTAKSPLYRKPFMLAKTTTVKALCVLPDGVLSPTVSALFTRATLRPADHPKNAQPGLAYQYYEAPTGLDNVAALTPVASGVAPTFTLDAHKREENFAFKFTGYLSVPKDGLYTFTTTSDDGSALFIGDTQVVDNGGMHGMTPHSGRIALAAGQHAITVTFYQGGGGYGLEVRYAGPGLDTQIIPADALCHEQ